MEAYLMMNVQRGREVEQWEVDFTKFLMLLGYEPSISLRFSKLGDVVEVEVENRMI